MERKALFKGRVNTEAIQDQYSTATLTHPQTCKHQPALPLTHPVLVSSCVSQVLPQDEFVNVFLSQTH